MVDSLDKRKLDFEHKSRNVYLYVLNTFTMRRLLLIAFAFCTIVLQAQASSVVVAKTDTSITFVVDEGLPAPQNKNIDLSREDVLYNCCISAYADHHSIVLSPDMIWITICQGFSKYVSAHAEELRSRFVEHEGKATLSITLKGQLKPEEYNWAAMVDTFSTMIRRNTKNGVADIVTADFSTTTENARIASEVTLMDCVKEYFNYELFYAACGIPSITLQGTADDWRHLQEKAKQLGKYGIEDWIDELEPILEEFVKAAEGKPNQRFWKSIVRKWDTDKWRGPSCARHASKPTKVDGWILKFFPNEKGKTVRRQAWTRTVSPSTVCVPIKYRVVLPDGGEKDYDYELIAGITGIDVDAVTGTFTPRIGWYVREKEKDLLEMLGKPIGR